MMHWHIELSICCVVGDDVSTGLLIVVSCTAAVHTLKLQELQYVFCTVVRIGASGDDLVHM